MKQLLSRILIVLAIAVPFDIAWSLLAGHVSANTAVPHHIRFFASSTEPSTTNDPSTTTKASPACITSTTDGQVPRQGLSLPCKLVAD